MTTPTPTSDHIRDAVRERYAEAAKAASGGGSGCCGPADSSCGCGTNALAERTAEPFGAQLYSGEERDSLPDAAKLASLGCGNPTAVAELHEGEPSWISAPAAGSTCCCPPAGSDRPARRTGST